MNESEAQFYNNEKLITLPNKHDKFFIETTSMEDRYDERSEELSKVSLSKFAKRINLARTKVMKNWKEKTFLKKEQRLLFLKKMKLMVNSNFSQIQMI